MEEFASYDAIKNSHEHTALIPRPVAHCEILPVFYWRISLLRMLDHTPNPYSEPLAPYKAETIYCRYTCDWIWSGCSVLVHRV